MSIELLKQQVKKNRQLARAVFNFGERMQDGDDVERAEAGLLKQARRLVPELQNTPDDQIIKAFEKSYIDMDYSWVHESSAMNLNLLKDLLLVEAKIEKPEAEKVKVDAGKKLEPAPVADEPKADDKALVSADKTAFFFRTKFDSYGMLEQTDDMARQREAKRVYSLLGREHERGAVYAVTDSAEREFKRAAKMLGISTDGEVTLERVKRAGFALAGRVGTKRLMKRGDFIVSLVGPSDDQAPITFYTPKPLVKEGVEAVKSEIDSIVKQAIKLKTPIAEAKRQILDILVAHEGEEGDHIALGEANRNAVKALRDLHPHSEFLKG